MNGLLSGKLGDGVAVSAVPISAPWGVSGTPGRFAKLCGPPKVPGSTSVYG